MYKYLKQYLHIITYSLEIYCCVEYILTGLLITKLTMFSLIILSISLLCVIPLSISASSNAECLEIKNDFENFGVQLR